MARQFPEQENTDSTFAFFFLVLYTASVLIRPHEMFLSSVEWITIKVFAIIAFIATIAAQRPLKLYSQHWMLLGLIPLIVVSGFLNGSGMDGVEQARKLFISAIIPLFLYSSCITSIKRQHILMLICIVAALFMVHNGHTQQTGYLGYGWALDTHSVGYLSLGEKRITYLGFFNDPNDLGMFLVMNIPFTLYFYTKGNFLTKVTMLAALTALGYGIYLTGSRGTMLGVGALLGIYWLVMSAGPKLFIAAAILSPIAATVITSLQSNIDSSIDGRLEAWYAGILMLISNPIFGVGTGNFMEEHERVAHNSYIHIAGELGIPGYSLWGGALVFTALVGYLFIIKTQSPEEYNTECKNELALNKTLFFSMIGFMITAFFLSRSFTLLLFIFMGMTIASHVRLIKLMPELSTIFSKANAIKSMGYCWVIIVAVYISLKMGL
ncbi:O-antigen ligase family protein [Colwellia psychrerythraea]|uniref:O-antigen polymerase family protein n=1 Tax=Colwellia psychrerythraea (strain 34H / ATCC BAA-681) TaxID=167879 RepID=Q47U80_COLP3|nr:O-antigen ligase family protein [Colwellia psychrerythraea]AAZ26943.1 O-antigen polymerase family protein [Colwellia psychrerythraea 34H]